SCRDDCGKISFCFPPTSRPCFAHYKNPSVSGGSPVRAQHHLIKQAVFIRAWIWTRFNLDVEKHYRNQRESLYIDVSRQVLFCRKFTHSVSPHLLVPMGSCPGWRKRN